MQFSGKALIELGALRLPGEHVVAYVLHHAGGFCPHARFKRCRLGKDKAPRCSPRQYHVVHQHRVHAHQAIGPDGGAMDDGAMTDVRSGCSTFTGNMWCGSPAHCAGLHHDLPQSPRRAAQRDRCTSAPIAHVTGHHGLGVHVGGRVNGKLVAVEFIEHALSVPRWWQYRPRTSWETMVVKDLFKRG